MPTGVCVNVGDSNDSERNQPRNQRKHTWRMAEIDQPVRGQKIEEEGGMLYMLIIFSWARLTGYSAPDAIT